MKVRKKLTIIEKKNNVKLKQGLFFLAVKMGLSGWVVHTHNGVVGIEVQGEEQHVKLYIDSILTVYSVQKEDIRCQTIELDQLGDGSLKIG